MFSLRRKRRFRDRIAGLRMGLELGLRRMRGKLPVIMEKLRYALHRFRRLGRSARYAADDAGHEVRKMSRHTEALLFSAIIVLGIIMLFNAGNADFLNSLIALVLLVLVVVIYAQLKFQKSMLDQYVPRIDYLKSGKCQLYSDRVRTVNLYGAKEKIGSIMKVRNVKVTYDVVNTSFSPVSIQSASLSIKLADGKTMTTDGAVSVLNVDPKSTSSGESTFRLARCVDFGSIEWIDLNLDGNCRKSVRLEPRLYANVMLRGKKQELIFEPFEKFRKRPEIASG